jgi:hypothetical protein
MATSFGTGIATVVTYRVHRDGAVARVRVFVGETTSVCVGDLALRPREFAVWRATLRDYDPSRFSIFYADGVFEWLHRPAEVTA